MKRKYYMRGLGVGILVTAILCAIAFPKKAEPMTDAEVIARAKELGYEKSAGGVTADDINKIKENEKTTGTPGASGTPEGTPSVTEEPEGTPGPTSSPVPTPEPPNPPEEPEQPEKPATPTPVTENKPTVTPSPKATATVAPTKKPTETPKATATPAGSTTTDKKTYSINVERGMTATKVAERLVAAGAISDANDFISYLRKNNLTDFINIGKFTIPEGASYKEIARILTGR
ncbi:MAG: hypothetical protein IJX95_07680 [Lachnospiraceae bacterium]|nr:hypothetical protein [Lachnospiraceae bacterium]